jgi:hypothetical protein
MNNWVVAVNSRDRVTGSVTKYQVMIPPGMPRREYKCTVRFITANLTATAAYTLFTRSPSMTRCLSTDATTNWATACTYNGAQQAEPGVVYFANAPSTIEFWHQVASTLADAVPNEHVIILHFEAI